MAMSGAGAGTQPVEAPADRPSVAAALGILIGVCLVVAGYVMLCMALALPAMYAGFLGVWYWLSVRQGAFAALPQLAGGGLAGIGTAALLRLGEAGQGAMMALALGLILVAVFLMIRGQARLIVNEAYMLYLTVMSAAPIIGQEDFPRATAAAALGIAYLGALLLAAKAVQGWRTGRMAPAQPAQ